MLNKIKSMFKKKQADVTENPQKLIRSMVQCLKCFDAIESKHRHDIARCSCGACAVDGGLSYQRIVGKPEDYRSISQWVAK